MNLQFTRTDAFSLSLIDPDSKEDDPIQLLLTADNDLLAFSGKSIFEVLPAEKIDPENTAPETRHSYQKIFPVGAENSFVARTIIQAESLLDSLLLRDGLEKQKILDHIWSCTKLLLACEASYYYVFTKTTNLLPRCDEIIEKGKTSRQISSLPQVDDLCQHVTSFLGNAKRFLEKTFELLCIFYNAPHAEANFDAYRGWMRSNAPEREEVNELLEQDKEWIRQIAWCRNALDINHSKPHFKLEISNFKLHPGNKFSPPAWRYDFAEKGGETQEHYTDMIHDMDIHMSNMLTFFEELFLFCLMDNWDNRLKFALFKKRPEDIDKKCPTLYFVSLSSNSIFQQSKDIS